MTPLDGIFLLSLVVPIGLVFARFAVPGFTWKRVWLLTPLSSWLIMNLPLYISPPHNGLAYSVSALLGWIWLLPVTGVLWMSQALVIHFVPRLPAMRWFQITCRLGLYVSSASAAILLFYGLFGWIGSERATEIAAHHLDRMSPPAPYPAHATWMGHQWKITFADGRWVEVSRTGDLLGGGGK